MNAAIRASILLLLICWTAATQSGKTLTLRAALKSAQSTDISLLPDSCLDAPLAAKGAETYLQVPCHLSPSAEQVFVFSRDGTLKGSLYGWALATLPNDFIVYHDSEVHFAPTHSLGVSVFDPATGSDRKIYPPVPYAPVRAEFIARVAAVYKARGDDWFREHNHHGDPEQFDSSLQGEVKVDAAEKRISFNVRYGDPENANDPLPFTETVRVTCAPIDSIQSLHCTESRD